MRPDRPLPILEHISELRSRLLRAGLAVLVAMLAAYGFSELLFTLLARPLVEAWLALDLGPPRLSFASPIEPFFTYLKLSLVAGLLLAAPVVFYELWMFVAPGLYRRERRYTLGFTVASALLFFGGVAFGYFGVLPIAFRFFLGFAQKNLGKMQRILGDRVTISVRHSFALTPTLMMGDYFSITWKLLLAFGLIFELPLLILVLGLLGLVTPRGLWRFNRHATVLAFVVGAVLTPPDVLSQVMMAVPLVVLYNLSIVELLLVGRRKRARAGQSA